MGRRKCDELKGLSENSGFELKKRRNLLISFQRMDRFVSKVASSQKLPISPNSKGRFQHSQKVFFYFVSSSSHCDIRILFLNVKEHLIRKQGERRHHNTMGLRPSAVLILEQAEV
jgi:hypothetical protein